MGKKSRIEKKSKRTRLSKDEIKKKSVSVGGGKGSWFNLPDGIGEWFPEKAGKYKLDILPYETTDRNHPNEVGAGVVWYQRPFKIHHGVGADNKSVVCPTSIGQSCPICEEIQRLSKDYEENEDLIRSLRPQRYVAFNIIDPEDADKVCVFAVSVGKFYSLLEKELDEADEDEDIANFFDVEGGKSLQVRFSKDSFAGKDFIKATKIDFIDRKDMDEDEIFSKVANLDEILIVHSYEKIEKMFNQDVTKEKVEEKKEEKSSKKNAKSARKTKKVVIEEEEEDFDEDDFDEDDDDFEDEEKPVKKSQSASVKSKSKPKDDDEDDDDWDDEDEDEVDNEDEDEDEDDWDDEDDDDWDDEDEDEEEVKPSKKSKAPAKKTVNKKKSKK